MLKGTPYIEKLQQNDPFSIYIGYYIKTKFNERNSTALVFENKSNRLICCKLFHRRFHLQTESKRCRM